MRAVWIQEVGLGPEHLITDESFHHLVHVIRVEVGEKILILNGRGLKVYTEVKKITKRDLCLKEETRVDGVRSYTFDLALGVPKREALELCLKQSVELGVRRIYLVRSAYSQIKVPEIERLNKVLISALEQSNAAFLPELVQTSWENLPWEHYSLKVVLDSCPQRAMANRISLGQKSVLVVGPEGGFSPKEQSYFNDLFGVEILHLPTPILRTPTAVATGLGCLLQRLMDQK